MANFDSGQWYQITLKQYGTDKPLLSLASGDNPNNGSSSVFFQISNSTQNNQRWQLFNAKSDSYVLRSASSGPYGYMTAQASPGTSGTNSGNTVPATANYMNIKDDSMYWAIKPWGDGSFFMQNGANGTKWHLEVEKSALMTMSSNITGTQNGQKFIFKTLGKISTKSFSTIKLPPSSTSSAKPSKTSITLSETPPGLSTAAIVGIGAAVGVLALLSIVLAILLFMRRRKNRHASTTNDTGYAAMDGLPPAVDEKATPVWNPTQQHNYAMGGGHSPMYSPDTHSPNIYPQPDQRFQSPPLPHFVELADDGRPVELAGEGQRYAPYKPPPVPSPAAKSPVEMDAAQEERKPVTPP